MVDDQAQTQRETWWECQADEVVVADFWVRT